MNLLNCLALLAIIFVAICSSMKPPAHNEASASGHGGEAKGKVIIGNHREGKYVFDEEEEKVVYGHFFVLGNLHQDANVGSAYVEHNGEESEPYPFKSGLEIKYKGNLEKREVANGLKMKETEADAEARATSIRTSLYTLVLRESRYSSVPIAGFERDERTDMFQFGLSPEEQNDFILPQRRYMSNFAFRILANRKAPHKVRIFAIGFDDKNQVVFRQDCSLSTVDGVVNDGFAMDGIRLLTSHWKQLPPTKRKPFANEDWREVSVLGHIYKHVPGEKPQLDFQETNELKDGTLIDLYGATLLWRSTESLASSPTKEDLEEAKKALPEHIDPTLVGMEPAFHLDLVGGLDHAFNGCNHVASERTVRFWSKMSARGGPMVSREFRPVCPFCIKELDVEEPFRKL